MNDRWRFVLVLLTVIAVAIALSLCSSTLRQWSPENRAQATILLWTPAPTWTPEPVVIEARTRHEQQAQTAQTAVVIGVAVCAVALLMVCVVVALSASARHLRATVQLESTRGYGRGQVLQLPGMRFYDPRAGAVDCVGDGQVAADTVRIQVNAGADAEVMRLLVAGITAKRDDAVTLGDIRALEYTGGGSD